MKKVVLILIPVFLVFVAGISLLNVYMHSNDNSFEIDSMIVSELEKTALPLVEHDNISYFFNSDWCQVLVENNVLFSSTIESTSDVDCGTRLTGIEAHNELGDEHRALFEKTRITLTNVAGKEFVRVSEEKPISYEPEHASLKQESIGLAFHLDCDFCRTRYVYWPGYVELPPDIDGEIKYVPINSNWYRVEQDWN